LYPEITDEIIEQNAHDAEHRDLLRKLKLCSAMIVPLTGRRGVVGAITFISAESGQQYDETDLLLAQALASSRRRWP
jgi:GAF domain-containing protein